MNAEYKPKPGEPKIRLTSMRSLAELLSDENRALLQVRKEAKPQSITSLAEITGRKPGKLSRTLKTMSNYGIVELRRVRFGFVDEPGNERYVLAARLPRRAATRSARRRACCIARQ